MKEAISITSHLRQSNAFAKELYKDKYPEKIKWFKEIIIEYKKAKNLNGILPTLTELLKHESTEESKLGTLMFISAAVDLIEEQK